MQGMASKALRGSAPVRSSLGFSDWAHVGSTRPYFDWAHPILRVLIIPRPLP